ncbi:tyrosyl-tRNA synthetase-like protein [Massariosphaeria phaeospora]|uniref:Tyrosine--tRNA ligase n=1 Tax=Massariosphaeria phaeospora TaxID=100035 RepID=A0A7C8IDJ0_9PLEO|nr:tyrosyl-tRNA synthetase-like protein [Massariosphaeria phaeospora]
MPLFRHLTRPRTYVCAQCVRNQSGRAAGVRTATSWAGEDPNPATRAAAWAEQARKIRSGAQQSMLGVLEERGFVKDVAGGREALDWLLTEKRIGAYVGVDPTAPSLHVGHLLPLMALYWMYLHGFNTVTLLGGGTVQIGDPSGRNTARSRQGTDIQSMNVESIDRQLQKLWINVKCLGIKYKFPQDISRKKHLLNNRAWLEKLSAVDLMRDLGSGMRLGAMLSRDSVKMRMETGEGMAISEFCYPLFQAYDWWNMYSKHGVQLQLGGSDQYGNIVAGMDAVGHMRKIRRADGMVSENEELFTATFGLTTSLLTTASGEKVGKSAGNAVWLDQQMLNSFDLYQYFLRTADDDVERYLKLFTFMPIGEIELVMAQQRKNESKRVAQHLLAKEIVELAHGAAEAKKAESAHKEAFGRGTSTFSLAVLRNALSDASSKQASRSATEGLQRQDERAEQILAYKKSYAGSFLSGVASPTETPKSDASDNIVTLPNTLLRAGSFPRVLHAAGLVSSRTEGHRLISNKGAYVVLPHSPSIQEPYALEWVTIPGPVTTTDPNHYLIDWEALVLRCGKSKFQICRIVEEEIFEAAGLSCPGWEEFKSKRAAAQAADEAQQ